MAVISLFISIAVVWELESELGTTVSKYSYKIIHILILIKIMSQETKMKCAI